MEIVKNLETVLDCLVSEFSQRHFLGIIPDFLHGSLDHFHIKDHVHQVFDTRIQGTFLFREIFLGLSLFRLFGLLLFVLVFSVVDVDFSIVLNFIVVLFSVLSHGSVNVHGSHHGLLSIHTDSAPSGEEVVVLGV